MKSLRSLVSSEIVPPPKQVEKLKFSAAGVQRMIDLGEKMYPTKTWSASSLYASGLGYTTVNSFILQYFDCHHPAAKKSFSGNAGCAMEVGTAVHHYLQNRLMIVNCLHPKAEGNIYQEMRFEDKELRIVSKVDGLIDEHQLAEFSGTKFEGDIEEPRPLNLDLLEIKVLASHKYETIKLWSDISLEYRMQATATQKISGYKRTIFMFVDRGSLSFRFIVYKAEEHLWEQIKKLSTDIFSHLRVPKLPEDFPEEWLFVNGQKLSPQQWIDHHVSLHPKRHWLHLGKDEIAAPEGSFLIG